jgi:MFS family permease
VALGSFAADTFPGREFGAIYGWITSGQFIGGAVGPWLGGLVFDRLGSYRLVFYGCIAGFALSALLVALAAGSRRQIHV